MDISTIYQRYNIMPLLKAHMIRAAAVGLLIADSWQNQNKINKDTIIQVLLLHDMGNIIKFDLDGHPELLGDEAPRLSYWQNIQKQFVKTYGPDEHQATLQIAREIDINIEVEDTLADLVTNGIQDAYESNDWNRKVCMYADLRCAPFSVVDVNKRFDDLIARYKGRDHELGNIEKTEEKRKICLELEKQLQEHVSISLNSIQEKNVEQYYPVLSNYTVGL